jgi:hypothetical protein
MESRADVGRYELGAYEVLRSMRELFYLQRMWRLSFAAALMCVGGCSLSVPDLSSAFQADAGLPDPLAPRATLSTAWLRFDDQVLLTPSPIQLVTITNTGTAPLRFNEAFHVDGDYAFGNLGTCSLTTAVAPDERCTASIKFTPTAVGTRKGTLSITSSASTTPQLVALSGLGVAAPQTTLHLYVSASAADAGTGTQAAPFRTIQQAASAVVGDTTVHVAPGVYSENIYSTRGGSAAGPVRFISDTRWGARIVPPVTTTRAMAWESRGAYVTIDGFEIDGSVDPASVPPWVFGISVSGTGSVVSKCLVHHIYNAATTNGNSGAGILLDSYYGFNDMVASNNIVHHVGPRSDPGNAFKGLAQSATGVIRNNLLYANSGSGLELWHDAREIDVVNNTAFGNRVGFLSGGGDYRRDGGPADYITFTNNIAFDNGHAGFDEVGENGTHNLFSNNLSNMNGMDWLLNTSTHSNDVAADPQFVNYLPDGGGNYRLRSTSPAIDQGLGTYAPWTDLDGVVRPRGDAHDLGAYEY